MAHRRIYPRGLCRDVSRPFVWIAKTGHRLHQALAAALESSVRKIKPTFIVSRLDDHEPFIAYDESWERARLRVKISSNFSHEATAHKHSTCLSSDRYFYGNLQQ